MICKFSQLLFYTHETFFDRPLYPLNRTKRTLRNMQVNNLYILLIKKVLFKLHHAPVDTPLAINIAA